MGISHPGFRIVRGTWDNGVTFTVRSNTAYLYARWYSPQGLKAGLNKRRADFAQNGFDHVVGLGNVELFALTIQEFDDLRKIPWRKRAKYMEVLAKAGEIDRIRQGLRCMRQLERELVALKAELAAL